MPRITGQGVNTSNANTWTAAQTFNDNIVVNTVGKGLNVKEGANARMGIATLSTGTVTVSTTAVTANSRIFMSGQTGTGTPAELTVSARVAGTSFTVTSASATDARDIAWMIFEPA